MSQELSSTLQAASEIADMAAVATGPVGIVAKIISVALKAGSRIAAAGEDPVIEITRILSPKTDIDGVHSEWDDFIARNFPPKSSPPPATETVPSASTAEAAAADPYPED